jgi:hypothetical protein
LALEEFTPDNNTTFYITDVAFCPGLMQGLMESVDGEPFVISQHKGVAQCETAVYHPECGMHAGPVISLVFHQEVQALMAFMATACAWQIAIEKNDGDNDAFRKRFWHAMQYFGDNGRAALVWLLAAAPDFQDLVYQAGMLREVERRTSAATAPEAVQDGPAAPPASDRASAPLACLCGALSDAAAEPVQHRPGCRHFGGARRQYPTVADIVGQLEREEGPEVAE